MGSVGQMKKKMNGDMMLNVYVKIENIGNYWKSLKMKWSLKMEKEMGNVLLEEEEEKMNIINNVHVLYGIDNEWVKWLKDNFGFYIKKEIEGNEGNDDESLKSLSKMIRRLLYKNNIGDKRMIIDYGEEGNDGNRSETESIDSSIEMGIGEEHLNFQAKSKINNNNNNTVNIEIEENNKREEEILISDSVDSLTTELIFDIKEDFDTEINFKREIYGRRPRSDEIPTNHNFMFQFMGELEKLKKEFPNSFELKS